MIYCLARNRSRRWRGKNTTKPELRCGLARR